MAEIDWTRISQSSISTPGSGVTAGYIDSTHKGLVLKDDSAFRRSFLSNFSTTSQAPSATTRTYITGSALNFAAASLQIGTMFRWEFDITKTGAGTATSTYDIAFGTAGTTSDTARVSFTKPAGVGNADTGYVVITAVCRGPLSASGVVSGVMSLFDNQTGAGGHLASGKYNFVSSVQSGTFDVTLPTFAGLCITTGTSDAITLQQVQSFAWNI